MTRNTRDAHITEDRRREVAALRRRRLTIRQIVEVLANGGRKNPRTGKPWDIATIHRDLEAIKEAMRAEAVKDASEHKAEILADYQELIRLAWVEKRYDDVRLVLRDVRALLGTDSPQVIIFEQVQARMVEALSALEMEFSDDAATLERAINALVGASDRASEAGRSLN